MVIDRYLAKELLQTLLAVLAVLLLIFIGRYLALFLADASVGEITSEIVLEMLFLRTITSLSVMLPFGLFIAVLVAFGRLYKDSEMTAMEACGVGPGRIMATVILIGVVCSVLVGVLALWITPWAHERALQVKEQAMTGTMFQSVTAGQFNTIGKAGQVFYVEGLSDDKAQLENIFIQSVTDDGRLDILSARSGYQKIDPQTGVRYLVLVDGYRYQGTPGSRDFTVSQYEKNAVRLDQQELEPLRRKRWAVPSEELWGSSRLSDQAELQWRFAMPLATILLAILGVLLSRSSPRQGRFAKLFISILVFVTYFNTLGVAISWIERGVIPATIGLWWVHGLALILIIILAIRHWGSRWLWHRLTAGRASS